MSTTMPAKTTIPDRLDPQVLTRVLEEGYGPGAWHGPDLQAALADVSPELAFWRPGSGRHNIAEIALHHAYCTRAVRGQCSGLSPEPFVLEGEDWFTVSDETRLGWVEIRRVVDAEQRRLARLVSDIEAGRIQSPLAGAARFDLALGITCHAIYHAGQVQLIKRLHDE